MTLSVFIYIYRIDMNINRLMPCSNKHNLHSKNVHSSNNKLKQESTFKSKQQSMQVAVASTLPCTIWTSAIFKFFFIDAINWKFIYLFFLVSLEYYSTSSWKYINLFLFHPEYYSYASSTHCICVFTFNSDILSFEM